MLSTLIGLLFTTTVTYEKYEEPPQIALEAGQFEPLTIEEKVVLYLGEEMLPVIECESHFRQFDESGDPLINPLSGTVGITQIHPVWFPEVRERNLDIWGSVDDNLRMAKIIMEKQGKEAWECYTKPKYQVVVENANTGQIEANNEGYSCVEYVQSKLGVADGAFMGDAHTIQPNTDSPEVGDVLLTNESPWGHVAIIHDIQDKFYILDESNVNGDGKVTIGRKIAADSDKIRGYFTFDTPDLSG